MAPWHDVCPSSRAKPAEPAREEREQPPRRYKLGPEHVAVVGQSGIAPQTWSVVRWRASRGLPIGRWDRGRQAWIFDPADPEASDPYGDRHRA
jgi:hypothetical protein